MIKTNDTLTEVEMEQKAFTDFDKSEESISIEEINYVFSLFTEVSQILKI